MPRWDVFQECGAIRFRVLAVAAVTTLVPLDIAHAQRAGDNAVTQAEDAFGTSVGRETIGLYSAGSVRGFSANAAGNARIDGLFFDPVWSPNARIRQSTAIRVGLSAQGFPFPAPTGVVDYALKSPDDTRALSLFASADTYTSLAIELDGVLPVTDDLSVAGGVGAYRNAFYNDTDGTQHVEGLIARWRPASNLEIKPFWSRSDIYEDEFGPTFVPGGAFLPPDPPRREFRGPKRPKYRSAAWLYGSTLDWAPADGWRVQGGLFRTAFDDTLTAVNLLLDLQPDGTAEQLFIVDPPSKLVSASGELRVTRTVVEGPRLHRLHLNVRARERQDRYGGSALIDLGPTRVGAAVAPLDPPYAFGDQTRDQVRQQTFGLAYEGRWRGLGEISLGAQKTDYEKVVAQPRQPLATSTASPWLYNASAAWHLSETLVAYAGWTRGLEESGVAPESAVNRGEALPAIETEQGDAGVRWALRPNLRLVVGAFTVRKPYFNLDEANRWTELGEVEHTGLEASLSGELTPRLSVVAGGVFMRPRVTGEGVRLGRVGPRPVGQPELNLQLNVDWRPEAIAGLSFDLGVTHLSERPATRDNRVDLPARTLVDLGARYRFQSGGRDLTLRAEVTNLFDEYGYDLAGAGAYNLIAGRVMGVSLAVDF